MGPSQNEFTLCLMIHLFPAAVFVTDRDVANYTICTIDDPRTLNKTLYLRPPGNVYSMNELVEIWEKKLNKELRKVRVSEEQLLESIRGTVLSAY